MMIKYSDCTVVRAAKSSKDPAVQPERENQPVDPRAETKHMTKPEKVQAVVRQLSKQ